MRRTLELGFPERRAISGDDDEFGLARTQLKTSEESFVNSWTGFSQF